MDKQEISEILTRKLGKKVVVRDVTLVGSGYHSDGYKITTDSEAVYFIKKIKSHDIGFEFPERKIMSLLVSHSMAKKHNIHPNSIGVVIKNDKMEFLPEISEDTEIYQFQEYGGVGKSYLEMLNDKANKTDLDQKDKEEIDKILDFIVPIHQTRHPSNDLKRLTALYNDWLRSVIGHPEYLLQLLQSIPDDSLLLKPSKQGEFVALMIENMHYFKNNPDRLVALHGDFWGSNVFFRKDGSIYVVDYSRMPYGDAGFDIGIWMSTYLFKYHSGNKEYFKKIGNYFLDSYIARTGDNEIIHTMVYSIGLVSVMYASTVWIPGIDSKIREAFFYHAREMLNVKKFFW